MAKTTKSDEKPKVDAADLRSIAAHLLAYAEERSLELPNVYANAAQVLMSMAEEMEA